MPLAKSAKCAKNLRVFRRFLGAFRVLGGKNGPVRQKKRVWEAFLAIFGSKIASKWSKNGHLCGFWACAASPCMGEPRMRRWGPSPSRGKMMTVLEGCAARKRRGKGGQLTIKNEELRIWGTGGGGNCNYE